MQSVHFEVKDKARRLRYDFNALADIEELAGIGAEELFSQKRAGFHLIRLLVWGGLKHEDKGLTVQRAGMIVKDMIEEGYTMEDVGSLVREALLKSGFVDPDEVGEDDETDENPTQASSPKGSKNSRKKAGK